MNKFFKFPRFSLILKNEAVSGYKTWAVYLLAIVGFYTVASLLVAFINNVNYGSIQRYNKDSINNLFSGFLFVGGYIISSSQFSDINDKFKSSLWISLPGSSLEKYLVGVLISSVGYVLFLILSFTVASLLSIVITKPIFGTSVAVFNLFTMAGGIKNYPVGIIIVGVYIFTQPLFLVGSIVFRKGAFIKTVLVSSVLQTTMSIVFALLSYIIVKIGITDNWDIRILESITKYLESVTPATEFIVGFRLLCIIGIPVALFFNVVGYLKLTEKEVKGGI